MRQGNWVMIMKFAELYELLCSSFFLSLAFFLVVVAYIIMFGCLTSVLKPCAWERGPTSERSGVCLLMTETLMMGAQLGWFSCSFIFKCKRRRFIDWLHAWRCNRSFYRHSHFGNTSRIGTGTLLFNFIDIDIVCSHTCYLFNVMI